MKLLILFLSVLFTQSLFASSYIKEPKAGSFNGLTVPFSVDINYVNSVIGVSLNHQFKWLCGISGESAKFVTNGNCVYPSNGNYSISLTIFNGNTWQWLNPVSVSITARAASLVELRTDPNNKLQVGLWKITSNYNQHNVDVTAEVPSDFIVVGGGAVATNSSPGALLTASYPSGNLSSWKGSSKSHYYGHSHTLDVYAIGIKVKGMTRSQLKSAIVMKQISSGITNQPTATASLPYDYRMFGGGFKVNWTGWGNLATVSKPDTYDPYAKWTVQSADHIKASHASITSYVIGIKPEITIGNEVYRTVAYYGFDSTPIAVGHPKITVNKHSDFVNFASVTGVGAEVLSRPGNLLWMLKPSLDGITVSSKDHGYSSPSRITGYYTLVYIVPKY